MTRTVTALLTLLLLVLRPAPAPSADAPVPAPAPAPAAYAGDFGDICTLIEKHFYDDKYGGLDWPTVRARYAGRAGAARTDAQFLAAVNEMLGLLHASHTRLYGPDDFEFYFLPEIGAGTPSYTLINGAALLPTVNGLKLDYSRLRPLVNGVGLQITPPHAQTGCLIRQDAPDTVAAVLDGSPAAQAGLQPGDVLLSVDGQPFHGLTQFGAAAARVALRRRGQSLSVALTPVALSPLQMLERATAKSARVIAQPGGRRVGYLHLWAMADPAFLRTLDAAVTGALHDTDGLILDLRGGFGGSPDDYGDVLFRPDLRDRRRARGQAQWQTIHEGYAGPVVALIDHGTRSAKEWLAWRLQTSRRAVLVGRRTAGAVLGEQSFPIHGRFLLELAVVDLEVSGVRLEGRGVAPDVAVPDGADDAAYLQAGLDALARRPLRRGG